MEPIYRQKFTIAPTDVDRFGRLKPSMMLLYAQEVAGHHSDLLSHTYDSLAARGMFWAVIRNRIAVTRIPTEGQTITLETWPMPTTRTAYPRSTVAYDEAGRELFRSVSLWILMDLNQRTMILPGKSGVTVNGTLTGTELEAPKSLSPKALEGSAPRRVSFTDLDKNGHMNNARYLDWISDLLPSSFHQGHVLSDVTLCYLNEAREGQELDVTWGFSPEGELLVDIHRPKGEDFDRIFSSKMSFRVL